MKKSLHLKFSDTQQIGDDQRNRRRDPGNGPCQTNTGIAPEFCQYKGDKHPYHQFAGTCHHRHEPVSNPLQYISENKQQPQNEEERPHDSEQFDVSDRRTLDEVVNWLMGMGYIPSFCTACYREGRTGDRFMSLCKSGQIQNCCLPNALMTLKEYLLDYASADTRRKGEAMIQQEIENIPREQVRQIVRERLVEIEKGNRDFRF